MRNIGYLAAPDQVEMVERTLASLHPVNCAAGSLRDIARRAIIESPVDLLIVYDGALPDSEIYQLGSELAYMRHEVLQQQRRQPENRYRVPPVFAFVGDSLRDKKDPLFTRLYRAGVTQLAGPSGMSDERGASGAQDVPGMRDALGPYNMYEAAYLIATTGVSPRAVAHLIMQPDEERAMQHRDMLEDCTLMRDRASYGVPARLSTTKIAVMQAQPRNGSTHTAIVLARALRALNMRTALVLPARHFASLTGMFTNDKGRCMLPPVDGTDGVWVHGLAVFPGETVNIPTADDYEFVVLDQGVAEWLMPHESGVALSDRARRQLGEFQSAAVAILATFMGPCGQWDLATVQPGATKSALDCINAKYLRKIRFAVFGHDSEETLGLALRVARRRNPHACVVGMDYLPAPFLTSDLVEHIPSCALELLATVLDKRLVKRVRAAQQECAMLHDYAAGENAGERADVGGAGERVDVGGATPAAENERAGVGGAAESVGARGAAAAGECGEKSDSAYAAGSADSRDAEVSSDKPRLFARLFRKERP